MITIKEKFSQLQQKKEKALIASLMAGDPTPDICVELAVAAAQSGVDILELVVPFADVTVGGAVIQEATQRALQHHTDMTRVFSIIESIRKQVDTPIFLSAYYNPLFVFGEETFCRLAVQAGACGVFVLDLPFGERSSIPQYAPETFPKIELVTMTTPAERLKKIAASASGFLGFIPPADIRAGEEAIAKKVQQIKEVASIPVCIDATGRTKEEIKIAADKSDGVILSMELIACTAENVGRKDIALRVSEMAAGCKQTMLPVC